jgi:hypothetical protein
VVFFSQAVQKQRDADVARVAEQQRKIALLEAGVEEDDEDDEDDEDEVRAHTPPPQPVQRPW